MSGIENVSAIGSTPFRTPASCASYWPGHQVHWIQARKFIRDAATVPVRVHVEPLLGTVQLRAEGWLRLFWHHDVEAIAAALDGDGPLATFSQQFHVLGIENVQRTVRFNLAGPEQAGHCNA